MVALLMAASRSKSSLIPQRSANSNAGQAKAGTCLRSRSIRLRLHAHQSRSSEPVSTAVDDGSHDPPFSPGSLNGQRRGNCSGIPPLRAPSSSPRRFEMRPLDLPESDSSRPGHLDPRILTRTSARAYAGLPGVRHASRPFRRRRTRRLGASTTSTACQCRLDQFGRVSPGVGGRGWPVPGRSAAVLVHGHRVLMSNVRRVTGAPSSASWVPVTCPRTPLKAPVPPVTA